MLNNLSRVEKEKYEKWSVDHQYHRQCVAWLEAPSQHTHASSLTWSKKSKSNSIQLKIHPLWMNDTGAITLLYLSFCWNDTETRALREVLLSDRHLTPLKACKALQGHEVCWKGFFGSFLVLTSFLRGAIFLVTIEYAVTWWTRKLRNDSFHLQLPPSCQNGLKMRKINWEPDRTWG